MTELKALWKNQTIEGNNMITLEDLRSRAAKFQARTRGRNLLLYVYSFLNIVAGLWLVATDSFPAMQAPMLLMIVAHLFVLWQIWRRVALRQQSPQASAQAALVFHRQELERQRGAVSNAWLWYIAPFMPAFIWELAIWWHDIHVGSGPSAAASQLFAMVVFSAVLFWSCVWLLFSRQAARLQLQIDQLNGLAAE